MNIKKGIKLSKIMAAITAFAMLGSSAAAFAETVQTGNYEITSVGTVPTSVTAANPRVTLDIYHLNKSYTDLLSAKPEDYKNILLQRDQMISDKGSYKFVLKLGEKTPTGIYTVRISSTNATEVKTETFTYANPDDYKNAVKAINSAANANEIEKIINDYKLSVGIDLTADYGVEVSKILAIMAKTVKTNPIDTTDTTDANSMFEICTAVVKLNESKISSITDLIEGSEPLFDLNEAALKDWYEKDYVSDSVKANMTARLSGKSFTEVKDVYDAMPQALVLAVVEKSGSNSGVREIIGGFSNKIGASTSGLSESQMTNITGSNYATYTELSNAIKSFGGDLNGGNSGSHSSSGGGGSGGSYGGAKQYPKPDEENKEVNPEDELNYYVFDDLEDVRWAKDSICKLAEMGVVRGKDYRIFCPNDTVTREEFVKMLVGAFGIDTEGKTCDFADVNPDEWYAPYVAAAFDAKIINGISADIFGVGQNISRQDLAVMAYNAAKQNEVNFGEETSAPFDDDSAVADYAKEAVYALKTAEIINGVDGKNFAPQDTATRAEAAKILYSLIKFMA